MKQHVKSITDLPTVLQDIEPWVKEPKTLYNGRKPRNYGLLPREIWANWLLCAIGNAQTENADWTFSDNENGGGDGILFDRASESGMVTEHIFIPPMQKKAELGRESLLRRKAFDCIL